MGFFIPKQESRILRNLYPSDGLENLNQIEDGSYWYWHRNRVSLIKLRNTAWRDLS